MTRCRRRAGCLAALTALGFAGGAAAEPLAPKKPSDVVAVVVFTAGTNAIPCNGFPGFAPSFVSRSDGTISDYSPPPRSAFVVTSISFNGSGASPSSAVNMTLAAIDAANPPAPGMPSFTFAGTSSDAAGSYTGSAILPTGFVIKPPALPCVALVGSGPGTAVLHGFFAKDK